MLWAFDAEAVNSRTGQQGKWKAWVVMVASGDGLIFFRINSARRCGSILLPVAEHPFLDHDSHLYCGGPPVLRTEPQLAAAMAPQQRADRQGIVGRIAARLHPDIRATVAGSPHLSEAERAVILAALDSLHPQA